MVRDGVGLLGLYPPLVSGYTLSGAAQVAPGDDIRYFHSSIVGIPFRVPQLCSRGRPIWSYSSQATGLSGAEIVPYLPQGLPGALSSVAAPWVAPGLLVSASPKWSPPPSLFIMTDASDEDWGF